MRILLTISIIVGLISWIIWEDKTTKEQRKQEYFTACSEAKLTAEQCDFAWRTYTTRYNNYTRQQTFALAKNTIKE